MTKQRSYSQYVKLTALIALEQNEGNIYQTAKKIGIPSGTLAKWAQAQREGRLIVPTPQPDLPADASLDDQLEQVARRMVSAMPEKVEEADLQELARALTIVLDNMNQTRAGKEKNSHAHEKLAEILERYAAAASAEGTPEPIDGG